MLREKDITTLPLPGIFLEELFIISDVSPQCVFIAKTFNAQVEYCGHREAQEKVNSTTTEQP